MSAIDDLFHELRSENKKAFMPFITAGDPDLEFTAECLRQMDAAGCHLVELGVPYSDPIADGPVIQASYTRALQNHIKLDAILEMVQSVSPEIRMPIVAMISYAIIFRVGLENFLERARSAGISGAIVPDMPVDESRTFARKCAAADFNLIQLITPTTSPDRAREIAQLSSGFIYYVSVTGITGERTSLPDNVVANLQSLRDMTEMPVCVGFGISQPEHAQMLAPVSDGVIVGSAIVKRIARASQSEDRKNVMTDVIDFCRVMLGSIR